MLTKTISIKRIYNNELSFYRQDDCERIDKDYIITEASRVRQSIEIDRCEIYDQNEWLRDFFVAKKFNLKRILTKQAMTHTFDRR
jgi:hypothetical protein